MSPHIREEMKKTSPESPESLESPESPESPQSPQSLKSEIATQNSPGSCSGAVLCPGNTSRRAVAPPGPCTRTVSGGPDAIAKSQEPGEGVESPMRVYVCVCGMKQHTRTQ